MDDMDKQPDPAKYYVTWHIEHHPEGLTKEEVEAMEGRSAAHDVVIFSRIHTGGGLSTLVSSKHHTGRELGPNEYFQAWTLFTELVRRKLIKARADDGPGSRLSFVSTVWETICSALTGGRSLDAAENIVHNVVDFLKQIFTNAQFKIRQPKNDDGMWWIDIFEDDGTHFAVLQFSIKKGWGLSRANSEAGYGEGPEEVFIHSEEMILRLVDLWNDGAQE